MNITLNIGLQISKHYLTEGMGQMEWKYHYVEEHLKKCFGKPSFIGLAQSATEKTVVVQYNKVEAVLWKLSLLAHELQQDCIAYSVQDADGVMLGGALVGKYAHEWNHGAFDAEYFIPATIKLNYRTGLPL